MKPYYETELGKLYHGDCLEIMPQLEPVDLVLTSPPYDDLRIYGGQSFDFKPVAMQCAKNVVSGGVVVWIVGDASKNGSESLSSFKHAIYFNEECGLRLHDTMIYCKNGPAYPSKNRYYQIFEYMFIFSIGKPKTFNPIKDRENKWYKQKWSKKRSRRNKHGVLKNSTWDCHEGEKHGTRFNIWKYNVGHGYSSKDKIAYEHPAIFPELLAIDHITSWSNQKDIVLDPMCGSGTTLKMAEKLNRKWIGIEIEEKYCEIAAKRIELERKQLKLFA